MSHLGRSGLSRLSTRLPALVSLVALALGLGLGLGGPLAPAGAAPEGPPALPASAPALARIYAEAGGGRDGEPARIRLLAGAGEAWYARWWTLLQAERTIDVQYFEMHDGVLGKALLGLLLHKAREGVRVRLMLDARGSAHLVRRLGAQAYLQELAELPNVTVRVFRPWHKKLLDLPRSIRTLIASNHDKLILVDGRLAVLGGRNLWDPYFREEAAPEPPPPGDGPADLIATAMPPRGYLDQDVLLESPAAATRIEAAFAEEFEHQQNHEIGGPLFGDWRDQSIELDLARMVVDRWTRGQGSLPPEGPHRRLIARLVSEVANLPALTGYPAFAAEPWAGSDLVPTKILDKRSDPTPYDEIAPALLAAIEAATERITIQNAYVSIPDAVRDALVRASARGVEIVLHTNSPVSNDTRVMTAMFLRDWKRLLRDMPTLRIFLEPGPRLVHSKAMAIDDVLCAVGSYNLDPMSERTNGELVALFHSPSLAARLRRRIEADAFRGVECRIRIEPDGKLVSVSGPEDFLSGLSGAWVRLLSKMGWLRSIL